MTKIKNGSVVRLKSGGIKMTVEFVNEPSMRDTLYSYANCAEPLTHVFCAWFDGATLCKDKFTLDSLEFVK